MSDALNAAGVRGSWSAADLAGPDSTRGLNGLARYARATLKEREAIEYHLEFYNLTSIGSA